MPKKHNLGLDGRCRDFSGEIHHKRGDTLVGTLRKTYGREFAAGYRSDTKLSTLLERTGSSSLREFVEHSAHGRNLSKSNRTSALSNTIFSITSAKFAPALKNLAKK
jgi:hypothetical protein